MYGVDQISNGNGHMTNGKVHVNGSNGHMTNGKAHVNGSNGHMRDSNGHMANGNVRHTKDEFDFRRKDLLQYGTGSNMKINEIIKDLIKSGKKVHHLAFGQSPFPVPEKMRLALLKHAYRIDYLPVAGVIELREAICHHHKSFPTGIPDSMLSPSNIIVADGSKILFYLIMIVTDSVVILKSPAWATYRDQVTLAGKKKIVVESTFEEEWKITPTALEEAIENSGQADENLILVFTNPGNPTGLLYSEEEMVELTKVFRKYKIIVISDEIYSLLTFSNRQFSSLAKVYPEGTIVTTGMSKWASAGGWRVGYGIFPPQLSAIKAAVFGAASDTYSCGAAPQQYAVAEFLNDTEACRDTLFHSRRVLEVVSELWIRKLKNAGIRVHPAGGAYYIYIDFSTIRTQLAKRSIITGFELMDALLEDINIAVQPGAIRHLEPETALTIRLCHINFDGAQALEESRAIGMEKDLDESFVYKHCMSTVEACESVVTWYTDILNG